MQIREAIIIPAILVLGLAGASLSGSEIAAAVGHATSVHTQATATVAAPLTVYHS